MKSPPSSPIASKSTAGTRAGAILHAPGPHRGRKHARYPEINMMATARLHGMSKSQLSRLLNGENVPSIRSVEVLAKILGKTHDEIMQMYREPMSKSNQKAKEQIVNAESIFPGRGESTGAKRKRG